MYEDLKIVLSSAFYQMRKLEKELELDCRDDLMPHAYQSFDAIKFDLNTLAERINMEERI